MRHRKHRHQLGVKKEHRQALIANLAAALFRHGRIQTTLAKAKALRPFSEKIITLAKKAHATEDTAKRLHFYRLAIARVRDKEAVKLLFDERAEEFAGRDGGYTRIYKLMPRLHDAAPMAIIELIDGDDEGYTKPKRSVKKKAKKQAVEAAAPAAGEVVDSSEETEVAGPEETASEPVAEAVETTEAPAETSEEEKKD